MTVQLRDEHDDIVIARAKLASQLETTKSLFIRLLAFVALLAGTCLYGYQIAQKGFRDWYIKVQRPLDKAIEEQSRRGTDVGNT